MPDYDGGDPAGPAPPPVFVLDLYAREVRDHAGGVLASYGLTAAAREQYKAHCFDAARSLTAAADCLRRAMAVTPLPGPPRRSLPAAVREVVVYFLFVMAAAEIVFWAWPGARAFVGRLVGG